MFTSSEHQVNSSELPNLEDSFYYRLLMYLFGITSPDAKYLFGIGSSLLPQAF